MNIKNIMDYKKIIKVIIKMINKKE